MPSRVQSFPAATLALLGACAGTVPAGEPDLVEVGMVMLEEPSTGGGLTLPAGFAMGPDGAFYITDARSGLVGFAPDGRFLRRFGAIGDGPGEYRWPTAPWVPDDSTLLVADMGRFSLTAFDRVSGAFRERQEGVGAVLTVRHARDRLLLGMLVQPFDYALRGLRGVTDSLEEIATLPRATVNPEAGMFSVAMVKLEDGLLAGAGISNQLILIHGDHVVDTLSIPVQRRRGVPANLADRFADTDRDLWMTLYSTQWAVATLGDGLIVVHVELEPLRGPLRPMQQPFTTRSLVSFISGDLTLACPDLLLPISPDLHPFVASRGDTLLVLDHHDTGADIQTVVRKFLVRTEGCEWQPVPRGGGNN